MATRKRKTTSHNNGRLPGWVWMFAGLAIGLGATFIPDFNAQYQEKKANLEKQKDAKTDSRKDLVTERKFDFYTLLPELEVVVPDEQNNAAKPRKENASVSDAKGAYVLQVGSFKGYKEADALKASLALLGIEANIQKVSVNSNTWHRVRVGPSSNKTRLTQIQKELREQRMDAVLLRERG